MLYEANSSEGSANLILLSKLDNSSTSTQIVQSKSQIWRDRTVPFSKLTRLTGKLDWKEKDRKVLKIRHHMFKTSPLTPSIKALLWLNCVGCVDGDIIFDLFVMALGNFTPLAIRFRLGFSALCQFLFWRRNRLSKHTYSATIFSWQGLRVRWYWVHQAVTLMYWCEGCPHAKMIFVCSHILWTEKSRGEIRLTVMWRKGIKRKHKINKAISHPFWYLLTIP